MISRIKRFVWGKPKGIIVKTKDNKEVLLVHDYNELKKIDIKDIHHYFSELYDEYTFVSMKKKKTVSETKTMIDADLKEVMKKRMVLIFVLRKDKVIGICYMDKKPGRFSHIAGFEISLLARYRGRGLGKLLMDLAFKLLKERIKGIKIIELGVYENNVGAIKLYKNFGFRIVARLPKAMQWKPPGKKKMKYKAEIIMHLHLRKPERLKRFYDDNIES